MSKRRSIITLLSGTVAVALVGWACERSGTPAEPDVGTPSFHEDQDQQQCPVKKFTGGGRIDPTPPNSMHGKVTFGFNIFLDENCGVKRGQIQVNHHPSKSIYHAGTTSSGGSIDDAFFTDACAEPGFQGGVQVEGTVRVKHAPGGWHDHQFAMRACDNGEPGVGRDTFRWQVRPIGTANDGHGDTGDATGDTPLTGGNIQAH
ncbi:MAG: hypothetical protein ACREMJ_03980 [Gemmatimonadales bacterium]